MKKKMFYIAFVASLGGLLFGFDTAVISGAEQAIEKIYGLSGFWHGFTMAIALAGTIIGAFFSSKPVEKYGRLSLLKTIAVLYVVSALGCALILNWHSFLFFRFLGGLAVGASSVVGPMYIAEISPSNWRGRFVAFFQFNIVFGIMLAYISNSLIAGVPYDWQWMLGVLALPALLFAVLLFTIPESPRWLIKNNCEKDAYKVFETTGEPNVKGEVANIQASFHNSASDERLFQKKYFVPIIIAFLIATFNQLSGINTINYYAPRIFEVAGYGADKLFNSILIGATNLIFTMLGMFLIDKLGRKKLIYIGSVCMFISLASVTRLFWLNDLQGSGLILLISLMGFIASFAVSLGAVIWVLIAEVFPTSVRAKGQVLGSMTHWVWCAALTWIFPIFVKEGQYQDASYIFGFYAIAVALSFVFAWKMPETKNKSLEQIQKELVK
ncbi:MAG: sugar porter family MFS transporter [Dysgonamonadaceae bacterium]|nr:sugar porter family MFS transporter [Dysgonamonadaceae bacterium]